MELFELGLSQSAIAIRDGVITSEQLVSSLLAQVKDQQSLNAFVSLDSGAVLNAARTADKAKASGRIIGPLHGVPIALKDNIDAVGFATSAGTPALRTHRPRENAAVVKALLDAGAIIFGKVGMHELALGITSNNSAFGAIRNPFGFDRVAGGSSGGSGAAVAAKMVAASVGTDTGGSVRVPASFCGVVGYRPSAKRWPQAGIMPISKTRDTPGPLTRSVEDLIVLDTVVTGIRDNFSPRHDLGGVRLGVPRRHFWEDLNRDTQQRCEEALLRLEQAGATLIEVDIHEIGELDADSGFAIALYEMPRAIDDYLMSQGLDFSFQHIAQLASSADVSAVVKAIADGSGEISITAYETAISNTRPSMIRCYERCFAVHRLDALVFPTTPLPAPPIGHDNFVTLNGKDTPTFETVVRNTGPGSVAGIPGVSLPVGFTKDGLPVGLALDAAHGNDKHLLNVAAAIEETLGRFAS